jgi:hypothetical protein
MDIEYRVRPVIRYIVTRYQGDFNGGSVSTVCECPNMQLAQDVANAFAGSHARVVHGTEDGQPLQSPLKAE